MTKPNPLVSIIIPTLNSERHLDACLKSTTAQTYPNVETIVVDQSSTDRTSAIARKQGATVITLPPPKFYSPPTQSRNVGAQRAKGQILYHIDSDMELSPKLIQELVERFQNDPKLAALIVHEEDRTKGFWSKCKALERRCYWGNDNIESARAVRREIFEKVGGYDESINSGEDFDIHRRYKRVGKIGFCDNVVYHNLGSLNFRKTISKKFNYGKTAAAYFNKHQEESGQSLLSEQLKSFIKHYSSFLRHPIIGTGAIFLKACEFGAGGFGLTITKIDSRQKEAT